MDSINQSVAEFILREFLPGEDPSALTSSTPLITGGVLDSIATLKLVAFLEQTFNIQVEPHEVDADNLDTIAAISRLVAAKVDAR
jgi:acyl carrier protein